MFAVAGYHAVGCDAFIYYHHLYIFITGSVVFLYFLFNSPEPKASGGAYRMRTLH